MHIICKVITHVFFHAFSYQHPCCRVDLWIDTKTHSRAGFQTSTAKMCGPRTAGPTTEPPQRLCGKEYFQLHILALQAPSFGPKHGRKCEICPTLTLSFLTRPRAAHEAKPGSERGILEGLKGSCGPPSRTRTGLLPMVPLWDTRGSLLSPHVSFFMIFSPPGAHQATPVLEWMG